MVACAGFFPFRFSRGTSPATLRRGFFVSNAPQIFRLKIAERRRLTLGFISSQRESIPLQTG